MDSGLDTHIIDVVVVSSHKHLPLSCSTSQPPVKAMIDGTI